MDVPLKEIHILLHLMGCELIWFDFYISVQRLHDPHHNVFHLSNHIFMCSIATLTTM